jgi:tetratricopeptide (TPR) repeat protein
MAGGEAGMRLGTVIAILFATACFAGQAKGAVTILGSSLAAQCSQATRLGRADIEAVETCDDALLQVLSTLHRAGTFVNRGILHMRRQDYDLARADFEEALARAPQVGEAWVNRGALNIVTKNYEQALADTNKGLELGIEEPEKAYYNRAVAHEGLKDATAAYHDYNRALAIKPDWEMPRKELTRFKVIRR